MRSSSTLLYGLASLSTAFARASIPDQIQEDLSFGQYGHHVWTGDHKHVAGFQLTGDHGHHPDLLSDRIVMTPPWPGNRRASLWAEYTEPDDQWSITTEFRAAGADHASGNMQVWYVRDKHDIGTQSIYTVGKFDGLAIVVDQHGGYGGSIRGFLNDGHTSYKDHHHVDSLPFGHCQYHYRNTGHFISLEVRHTSKDFEVLVDGHRCFHSKKVKLHPGNYFGLTAASADQPDSFEIKSFVARGTTAHTGHHDTTQHEEHHDYHEPSQYGTADHHDSHQDNSHVPHHDPPHHEPAHHTKDPNDPYSDKGWYWVDEKEHIKDASADSFKTEQGRFSDVHDRVQLMNHQLDILFHDISVFKEQMEDKQRELISWLTPIHDYVTTNKHMLERIEAAVENVKKDVETKEFKEHLESLQHLVAESHQTLMLGLPQSLHSVVQGSHPRFGFFVFIVIASQVMLLGSYMVYRRRVDSQPKKYL